ncbi:MAG: DUF4377 domain-containing protein [Colwellia sp.]|nr:DUF4377 domain-containing protein [Colwellia sp.]
MYKRIVLLLVVYFFTTSCVFSKNSETKVIEFLSYKKPCFSLFQRLCYVARNTDSGANEFFYNSIDRFDFVWGHNYKLSLKITTVGTPPADGSRHKYELEKMIVDIEDSLGTKYEYKRVKLLPNTFTKESGSYYFLAQPFECHVDIDCEKLINLNNSGSSIDLSFEYAGDGKIALVEWSQAGR